MQDVLWCFSQVKGTADTGVTEGKFVFPLVAVIKKKLFVVYVLPSQCAGACSRVVGNCWQSAKSHSSFLPSLCTDAFERHESLKLSIDPENSLEGIMA